ncbi:PREDICTED: kallikrein-4-like [Chinchilla lanigera]|uniref:kallikrein-4-like n=1 Tax=Chinchilla lanigera TaxID=34839 RepID=UPI0006988FDF|nr:PREDICTED: kallikrein-4-like [Chinchilla lanigera]
MGAAAEVLWLCFLGCIIHPAAEAEIPSKGTGSGFPGVLPVFIERISGGFPCVPHSHPWIAALFENDDSYCAGVLVHPQWVLSAAHCWNTSYTIGLGLHGLFEWDEPGSQIIQANFSVQHPEYIRPSNGSDLMLIKLNRPVVESDTIRTIPIASECPTAGTRCRISGWGRLLDGYYPLDLQCAVIPVVSEEYCRFVLDSYYHDSMFCAGAQGHKDSCPADSGGPVVCNGVLQGLVSWGFQPCGTPGVPGFYTNLCKFKDWINEIIKTR